MPRAESQTDNIKKHFNPEYSEFCLLEYNAGESQPTFRSNIVASCLLDGSFLLGLLFDLEYGGYMFLRNVG
jgi:hypothetical protein